ncbi:hypothetical protein ACHQM5_008875 [Ranunculus cassubicifolius]
MGRKNGIKLTSSCLNRLTTQFRIRSSPPTQFKSSYPSTTDQKNDHQFVSSTDKITGDGKKPSSNRRVMIVIDSSVEAKCALQWALSHTVQNHDVIVLLNVNKPSKQGEDSNVEITPKNYEFLYSMKNLCHLKRPEVQVEFALVEGKDKGAIIVEEAKKREIALLVLGQKKRSITWWLLLAWAGNKIGGGVVEYCIQNATCMAVAVRRKSKKLGGYLITTKRHKDFWLLA